MDTERTQEIARIRARVEADYRVANGNRALYATELAITDVRTLLAELDRLQAVAEAAGEVVADVTTENWYEDAFTYLVDAEALETLKALHDALKGTVE